MGAEGPQTCCCNQTQGSSSEECCFDQNEKLSETTRNILISIHVVLIVTSLFGNSLVFKAFHKFPSLRTASNVIPMSLSAADSLIAIAYILRIMSLPKEDPQDVLCKASGWFSFTIIFVITKHLALISVERFIAVRFSLRYHTVMTKRRALFMSLSAWLWPLVVSVVLPLVQMASANQACVSLGQALHPCSKRQKPLSEALPPSARVYLLFVAMSMLVIPLAVILCSYSYIFLASYKHRKQIREQNYIQGIAAFKHEMKGARTLAIVVTVCLISILPLLVMTCLRLYHAFDECLHPEFEHITCIVYDVAFGLKAICNPVIYAWKNENFRSSFGKLIKCS